MFQRSILTICFVMCSAAFADFSGNWAGGGRGRFATKGVDLEYYSCQHFLVINQTSEKFVIAARSECIRPKAGLMIGFVRESYDISGNDLVLEGAKVGTISDTKFELDYYSEAKLHYQKYSAEYVNGILKVDESWRREMGAENYWEVTAEIEQKN